MPGSFSSAPGPTQLSVEAKKVWGPDIPPVARAFVEWFDRPPKEYRDSVLPPDVSARVAVEAAIAQSWHKLVGDTGEIVSIEHYGESADDMTLFVSLGSTPRPSSLPRNDRWTTDNYETRTHPKERNSGSEPGISRR